jgi:hypothetical protein
MLTSVPELHRAEVGAQEVLWRQVPRFRSSLCLLWAVGLWVSYSVSLSLRRARLVDR